MMIGEPEDDGPQDAVPAWWTDPRRSYPPPPGRRPSGLGRIKVAIFSIIALLMVGSVLLGLVVAHFSAAGRSATAVAVQTSAKCDTASSISTEPIGYHACGAPARNVGIPDYNAAEAKKTYTVTIKTNRGDIDFTADGNAAPYTVYSFVYLVERQYYSDTPCHRLTTNEIYVLQCGDPSGTGSGGPGYAFQDENLASLGTPNASGTVVYRPGTVAMANAGPDTNGSQFFFVYQDSPLAPSYTPFGTVTQGLDLIQQVAKAGTDDSNGTGDGIPNDAVQIESVTVR